MELLLDQHYEHINLYILLSIYSGGFEFKQYKFFCFFYSWMACAGYTNSLHRPPSQTEPQSICEISLPFDTLY
jgi:hypothetical protein